MKVTKWEIVDVPPEADLEAMQQSRPLCKNERHNLFWHEEKVFLSTDTYTTIGEYGIFELRWCTRCGRDQMRYHIPDDDDDVELLRKLVDDYRMTLKRDDV